MKKIIMVLFSTFAMVFFFNAHACQTGVCNYDSDCSSYAPICTSGKANCHGAWDEDPFKSGKQGCHGKCECTDPKSEPGIITDHQRSPEPAKPPPTPPEPTHKKPDLHKRH